MPPKKKISKEQLVEIAFAIAEKEGFSAITIRKVAEHSSCSIAPIYVNFEDVHALKHAVIEKAILMTKSMIRQMNTGDPFLDIGAASIKFARLYPHIFDELILKHSDYAAVYDESNIYVVEEMKKNPDLSVFSDKALYNLLTKLRALQIGLSILAKDQSNDAFSEEHLIDILSNSATDLIHGMKTRGEK